MFDHIGISASDFERSLAFYRAALAPLSPALASRPQALSYPARAASRRQAKDSRNVKHCIAERQP